MEKVDIYVTEEEYDSSQVYFNYHDISKDDMNNGEGLRVVLWLAGCNHRCPGCHNPETWDPASGIPFTDETYAELFEALSKDWIEGITFSGGDPLFPSNREAVANIIGKIKKLYPEKTIWLYTGYTLKKDYKGWFFRDECPWLPYHETFAINWIEDLDVIVDGPFDRNVRAINVQEKNDPYWCGSSNQRVIDVKATIATGDIVLYETE